MKHLLLAFLLFLLSLFTACSESATPTPVYGPANVELSSIEGKFLDWWVYHNDHINLSTEFLGFDTSGVALNKENFLESLRSGNYVPIKHQSSVKNVNCYQLHALSPQAELGINTTIIQLATKALQQFKMEGTPFPDFEFTDLNGQTYNNANTKGKTMLIKCWFIGCKACIDEFPELNQLVADNRNRDDILFISLAFDEAAALEAFLLKKPFDYAVIPLQRPFMNSALQVGEYPTHFIVDEEGIIRKVVNKVDELIAAL